jgi:hypothetical protein
VTFANDAPDAESIRDVAAAYNLVIRTVDFDQRTMTLHPIGAVNAAYGGPV